MCFGETYQRDRLAFVTGSYAVAVDMAQDRDRAAAFLA
jgi:hypothetical protein